MPLVRPIESIVFVPRPITDYSLAWKTKPSWYLVATDDKMIPPDAQRAMSKRAGSTVVEAKGSHAVYVSQPQAVADLIAKAANGVTLATR
jgi:pimeloyl-ACP methyl ester carboxylesterase